MTREEAIAELNVLHERLSNPKDCEDGCYSWEDGWYVEAIDMAIEALSADAEPTVIRSKTLMPTKDFNEWAKRVRETNPNVIVIPCDAEVVSDEAVQGGWIIEDAHTEHCSVCGYAFHTSALFAVGGNDEPNFCPNCGAKMKGGDSE